MRTPKIGEKIWWFEMGGGHWNPCMDPSDISLESDIVRLSREGDLIVSDGHKIPIGYCDFYDSKQEALEDIRKRLKEIEDEKA